jgi:hypothetical protein
MASDAIKVCRVVAGKGAAAVVTLETIESGSRPVFEGGNAVNLLSLPVARLHLMALITAFANVIRVTENDLWTILRRQRSYVIGELVANTTGIVFILSIVANITSCMGLKTCRNGFAASGGCVASRAAFGRLTGAVVMIRVIENGIEPFSKLNRECFDRRVLGLQICMANNADRLLFSDPLVHVTSNAGLMSAKLAFRAVTFALMTYIAFELQVFWDLVRKILKCLA